MSNKQPGRLLAKLAPWRKKAQMVKKKKRGNASPHQNANHSDAVPGIDDQSNQLPQAAPQQDPVEHPPSPPQPQEPPNDRVVSQEHGASTHHAVDYPPQPLPSPRRPARGSHIDQLIVDPVIWQQFLRVTTHPQESGGLLIGTRAADTRSAQVLGFIIPVQKTSSSVYCEFDDRWVGLTRAALIQYGLDDEIKILAWIHTHPRLSVFLSGTDVQTIDTLQNYNPLLLAVVVDPYRRDIGAFHFERRQSDTKVISASASMSADLASRLQRLSDAPQLRGAHAIFLWSPPKRQIEQGRAKTQAVEFLNVPTFIKSVEEQLTTHKFSRVVQEKIVAELDVMRTEWSKINASAREIQRLFEEG